MKTLILLVISTLYHYSLSSQQSLHSEEVTVATEFLTAVSTHNGEVTHRLLDEHVIWNQPGNNALSGNKKSASEVFAMSKTMHRLSQGTLALKDFKVLGVNGNQVVFQLHFTAARPEGAVLDVQNTDVYTIANGKIVQAQVFSADLAQEDYFWGK